MKTRFSPLPTRFNSPLTAVLVALNISNSKIAIKKDSLKLQNCKET